MRTVLRRLKLMWQIATTGWCDVEIWNLNASIISNLLPRLRRYIKIHKSYPVKDFFDRDMSSQQWDEILYTIETTLVWLNARELYGVEFDEDVEDTVARGKVLIGMYLMDLWD